MSGKILLKGGRVVDPSQSLDGTLDVLLARETVVEIAADIDAPEDRNKTSGTVRSPRRSPRLFVLPAEVLR